MSKHEDNVSDDEFHDAISMDATKNNESEKKLRSTQETLNLFDDSKEPTHSESESSSSEDPDNIDEIGLKEEEEFISEEQKLINKEKADKFKEEGNESFKNQKYKESSEAYTKALMLCPLRYTKERSVFYANRAAAKIQLNLKDAAIEDCNKAIKHNPNYVRALMRYRHKVML